MKHKVVIVTYHPG